jgi:DNA invertase Pin-like site-specific DNA recombinase
MARFLLTVSAATGELEAARAGEGTSKAMRQKAVRGEFTGGEPPFGKMVGLDGVLVECAREQAIVALVREYRADSMSLRKIVERLKEGGVVGRTGKPLAKTQLIKILSYVPA